jgi:hypothetical protein
MKPGWSASRRVNLLYVSTSLLWWQAVAGRIGVQSSHALRSNSWRTWRHRAGARNGHHTALHRALSPLHPCGSVTVGVHGCPTAWHRSGTTPQAGTPQGPHTGEGNDPIAFTFLVMRCPPASPLFASWPWSRHNWIRVGSY